MLVFGNPARHPRLIEAKQAFLPRLNVKKMQESTKGGRSRARETETVMVLKKRGRGTEEKSCYCQAEPSLCIQKGISHYDSVTVYCTLQRAYYNGLLAFMLPFTLQVQHLHPERRPGFKLRRTAMGIKFKQKDSLDWKVKEPEIL